MSILEQTRGPRASEVARRQDAADETLRRRAGFLGQRDRTLIELALEGRLTRREVGRLLGIPAGTVTRQVRRLAMRLHDPLVVALLERPGALRDEYRQLGIEYFLQKQTLDDLADLHQIPRPQVRQMIEYVRGWFRGVSGR